MMYGNSRFGQEAIFLPFSNTLFSGICGKALPSCHKQDSAKKEPNTSSSTTTQQVPIDERIKASIGVVN